MTHRNVWPKRLAKRCEAVGWDVVVGRSGHYKVTTHTGAIFIFPSTPGDHLAERNTIAAARRHGLEKRERDASELAGQERKQRIALDRDNNDKRLAALAMISSAYHGQSQQSNEEGQPVATEYEDTQDPGLGQANGVVIIERQPAMTQTPLMKKPAPLANGYELLLADGRVVYRCENPDCNKPGESGNQPIFDNVKSLHAHMGKHKKRATANEEAGRLAESRRISAEIRRAKASSAVDSITKGTAAKAHAVAVADLLVARLEKADSDLEKLREEIYQVALSLREFVDELPDKITDEETIDKARRWDQMRKLMS